MAGGAARIPEASDSRDAQALRRQSRTYGLVSRDPADPIEGWTWIRKDLAPPELRVQVGGAVYRIPFIPV